MKIYPNFINQYNSNNNLALANKCSEFPSFQRKINNATLIRFLHLNPILHFKNFTTIEYSNLSEKEINRLRTIYDQKKKKAGYETDWKYMEDIHHNVAEGIQCTLDTLYGKNNYKVIIIGRSLSSIGKVLGYRIGEDNVVNIPMSQAYKFLNIENIEPSYLAQETKYLNKFLASCRLEKENIKRSSKHYIVTDYCHSGNSLKGIKNLFSQENVWNKNGSIHYVDVMELVSNEIQSRHTDLRSMMSRESFKPFSFVRKLRHFVDIQNSFKQPWKELYMIKMFWFKLLDNELSIKA